ncbi:MAG: hypothetical protein LBU69_02885 [Deltaproteobacteria bacterium]|nr:hypothetical protein [Deltaproteobacteria bacterium]
MGVGERNHYFPYLGLASLAGAQGGFASGNSGWWWPATLWLSGDTA